MIDSAGIAIATVHCILIVINVVGNSLVCLIIKRNRDMRVPTNFLLASLAVSDILYATFILPDVILSLISTHPDGMIGTVLCKGGLVAWFGAANSIFTLVSIAVERYYAVMYPLGSKGKLTTRRLKAVIACCWGVSVTLVLPMIIVANVKNNFCMLLWTEDWMPKAYDWMWFVLVALSTVLMVSLYSRVVYTLWFKRNEDNELTYQQRGVLRVRKRVTLMVITVTTLFAICWQTDTISHVSISYNDHKVVFTVIHTMILVNSSINPFVYALINKNFRDKIKEMLCCTRSSSVKDLSSGELHNIESANKIIPSSTAESTTDK
ncbi:pyroglutamylated RF-amide peptide receptor-like [Oculina patagonica]